MNISSDQNVIIDVIYGVKSPGDVMVVFGLPAGLGGRTFLNLLINALCRGSTGPVYCLSVFDMVGVPPGDLETVKTILNKRVNLLQYKSH
jgi:hypothetical protein